MLSQAKKSGIDGLLHVPIILLMVCTILAEEKMLPKQKTDIVGTIFKLAVTRAKLKIINETTNTDFTDDLLLVLGRFSWQSLQKGFGQLLLNKV